MMIHLKITKLCFTWKTENSVNLVKNTFRISAVSFFRFSCGEMVKTYREHPQKILMYKKVLHIFP